MIGLATVFGHAGLDRWIADCLAGAMGNFPSSQVSFVTVLALFCFAVSFVVRWQAAAPLITIALAPVADAAGIHPYIVALIAVVACHAFLLPYQSATYLALATAIAFAVWTVVAGGAERAGVAHDRINVDHPRRLKIGLVS